MNPEKLGISACDLESLQQEQSTQTSALSIDKVVKSPNKLKTQGSRLPLPKDIIKSDKSSLTVFEFCQIIQDPESPKDVTIIKETVTEESRPHPSVDNNNAATSSQDVTANRYRYCREVIKPYLKNSDCVESEEELLKNALDSVSVDFPDYQPCFEIHDNDNDTRLSSGKSTSSRRSNLSKVDASTSTDSSKSSSMENTTDKEKCVSKTKSSEDTRRPRSPIPAEHCKEPAENCKQAPRDCSPKCAKKKSVEGIAKKKCSQESLHTRCTKEPAMGMKCTNPTFYLTERCKDCDSIPNIPDPANGESEDSFLDKNQKTITTLKVAMEDIANKVYKTTKDAVTLITAESAKQIDNFKQMKNESNNTDASKNKGSETLTSFNFFRKVDSTEKQDMSSGSKPELPKISDVIGNIISKVDSTLSMLSDRISLDNLPDCMKNRSFNDASSPYDKPSPPKEVLNVISQQPPAPVPVSNSMFATIKDKIVSMFREEEPKPTESESPSSTMSSSSRTSDTHQNEDNDEQLMDKLIE